MTLAPVTRPVRGSRSWIVSLRQSDADPSAYPQQPIIQNPKTQLLLWCPPEDDPPACAKRGSCAVIFSGRLFNGEELRKESEDFRESSDAELILQGYFQFGAEVIPKIKGVFAFVLCDLSRDLFLCVRDPLGVHPLFYSHAGSQILTSPSIKRLADHPSVSREINRARLCEHLCNQWLKPEDTYFANVFRILPGHGLRKVNGRFEQFRHWEPVPATEDPVWITDNVLERFDECLEQAVTRCLEFGPSAIFLSGGLDSVSVASVALDVARRKGEAVPYALSLVFPDPECNEENVQKGVAEQLGLPQFITPLLASVGEQGLMRAALNMSEEWPSPLLSPWTPGYEHLAAHAVNRGCKVILTGGGGDEWLTVTPSYAADLLQRLDLMGLYRLSQNLLRSYRLSKTAMLRFILWQSGIRTILSHSVGTLFPARTARRRKLKIKENIHSWVAPDASLRKSMEKRVDVFVDEMMSRPARRGRYQHYFRNLPELFVRPFASMVMEEQSETGQRAGAHLMSPYYDSDLVELLLRIPPEILQTGGREKGLVRETVAKRFPELSFDRQQKITAYGFIRSVFFEEGPKILREIGGLQCLINLGIVDSKELDSVLSASLLSKRLSVNHRIWDLLSLELWSRARF